MVCFLSFSGLSWRWFRVEGFCTGLLVKSTLPLLAGRQFTTSVAKYLDSFSCALQDTPYCYLLFIVTSEDKKGLWWRATLHYASSRQPISSWGGQPPSICMTTATYGVTSSTFVWKCNRVCSGRQIRITWESQSHTGKKFSGWIGTVLQKLSARH